VYLICESLSIWTVFGLEILPHINFLLCCKFSPVQRCTTLKFQVRQSQPMLTQLFEDATFSPPPNLYRCIPLVEVYRFGQYLGKRFSPVSTFFSLLSSRAFRDAPHSRFWRRHFKLCLLDKMLDLALSQIYTRVFHLW